MQGGKQSLWPRLLTIIALIITLFSGIVVGRLHGSILYLPVVLLFVAFVILLSFRFESLPFLLLISLLYIETLVTIWSGPSPIFISLGILAVLFLLVQMALGKHKIVFEKRSTFLALVLTIWATLSAFNVGGLSAIIGSARSFWFLFTFFLVVQNYVCKPKYFVQVSWALVISLTLISAWIFFNVGVLYFQSGLSLTGQQLHFLAARLTDRASLYLWMVIAIPFTLYLITINHSRKFLSMRTLLYIILVSLILGIFSMYSVNGTFAVILSLVLWFLVFPRFSIRMKIIYLTAISFFFVLVVFYSPFSDRINQQLNTIETGTVYEIGTDRGLAWYIGWQAIKEAPIMGLGPNINYILKFSQPYLPDDIIREKVDYNRDVPGLNPHNMYIILGALVGIPGFLLYMGFILSIMLPLAKRIIDDYKGDFTTSAEIRYLGYALFVSLTVYLIQVLALGLFIDKYLWLLLGIAASFIRLTSSKTRVTKPQSSNKVNILGSFSSD